MKKFIIFLTLTFLSTQTIFASEIYVDRVGNSYPRFTKYDYSILNSYSEGAYDYLNKMLRNSFLHKISGQDEYERILPHMFDKKVSRDDHLNYVKMYFQINKMFSENKPDDKKQFDDFSDKTLYRGDSGIHRFHALKVGDYFRDNGFGSTSMNEEVARRFSVFKNPDTGEIKRGYVIQIKNVKKGLDIMPFSASIHEEEVLLPPRSVFKIAKLDPKGITDLEGNIIPLAVLEYVELQNLDENEKNKALKQISTYESEVKRKSVEKYFNNSIQILDEEFLFLQDFQKTNAMSPIDEMFLVEGSSLY